jgi:hypothetical protein
MSTDDHVADVQQPGQADAASPADTASSSQAAVSRTDTRFKVGNQAAVKHGLYAARPVEVLPADVQTEIDGFRAAVLADLAPAGVDSLTAIEDGYLRRLCDVEACVRLAALNILRNGFTARSEGMLLQAVDRWDRIASRLGTKRRVKDIRSMGINEYLRYTTEPAEHEQQQRRQPTPHTED